MSAKRIFLYPGFINDSDGNVHFITARQLACCYGVNLDYCIVMGEGQQSEVGYGNTTGDLHLMPNSQDNYERVQQEELEA